MSAEIIATDGRRSRTVSKHHYYLERHGNTCRGLTRDEGSIDDISSPTKTRRAECIGRIRVRRRYYSSSFSDAVPSADHVNVKQRALRHRVAQPRAVRLSPSRNRTINACDNGTFHFIRDAGRKRPE